jgi:Ca2+/Na+ antiporter
MAQAQRKGLQSWQWVMLAGFILWLAVFIAHRLRLIPEELALIPLIALSAVQLVAGLTILQGACEALILGVERLGARYRWDSFIAGTIGEIASNLPEFVVIAFLVRVDALMAFLLAVVAIYSNALAFSVYSFFLPKDVKGKFLMPDPITRAGTEVLIAGSGIALVIGFVFLALRSEAHKTELNRFDLGLLGIVLLVIFGFYLYSLMHYYSKQEDEDKAAPLDPVMHNVSWLAILGILGLGTAAAFVGGERISAFADSALHRISLPQVPTALILAFFAGVSEYLMVIKAHRKHEMGIALSNVFGAITQQMFLVFPFTVLAVAAIGATIPINFVTTISLILLFPVFFVLFEYLEEDHTLNNLDAAGMVGIFALIVYVLLFMSGVKGG